MNARRRHIKTQRGMALVEYAVLIGAILLGVSLAARTVYQSFLGYGQAVEREGILF